jgi:hypothetical protein
MAKKRAADQPQTPAATPAGNGKGGGPITKKEAVKRALAEGLDMPADGIPWIKKQFGLDLKNQQFSSYKLELRGKQGRGGKGRGGRKPGPKAAQPAAAAPTPKAAPVSRPGAGNPLDAARQVKELCERYGAETVKGLADLFAGAR